ncbi:hypothetical protein QJS10_CPA07g00643 [Acorus calamus]|uniref:Uncharacterized protein n=1 Tax=Acorus calamus TaxID=4465 RepID=A0AAV9EGF4_ACOCL|nr:hypothetical protein QJS10_CPA07g00643 [Acorus calamus]
MSRQQQEGLMEAQAAATGAVVGPGSSSRGCWRLRYRVSHPRSLSSDTKIDAGWDTMEGFVMMIRVRVRVGDMWFEKIKLKKIDSRASHPRRLGFHTLGLHTHKS